MLRTAMALAVLGLTLSPETIPPQPVDGRIQWVYDHAEGKKVAAIHNKPLFVVFRCER